MKFSSKIYIIMLFLVSLLIIILLIRYLYKNIERKILLESFAASSPAIITTSPPLNNISTKSRKKDPIESVPLIFKNDGLVDDTDNYMINPNTPQAGYPKF